VTIGAAPRKVYRQELKRLRDEAWAALEAMPVAIDLPVDQRERMAAARERIAQAVGAADAVLGERSS